MGNLVGTDKDQGRRDDRNRGSHTNHRFRQISDISYALLCNVLKTGQRTSSSSRYLSITCISHYGFIGYLDQLSQFAYSELGATVANILVGIASAIVDNIPVMVAVLQMSPDMDVAQWLLVTLTAGVGGSLLSIGSAAGVALMGQARGQYTFFSHLKWTPAIAAGFALSIWVHFLVNSHYLGVAPG